MTESHLDDESLSAAIDGQDAQATTHLSGCAACRSRSAALDAARRAVAAPPADAPAGLGDRAVAAALAAYAGERAAPRAGDAKAGERAAPRAGDAKAGDPGVGNGAVVMPLRRPLEGQPDSFTSAGPAGHQRRRLPAWALGVAAALAAVLVAVPLLNRGSDDEAATVATGSAAGGTSELAAGVVVDGGDLGDQSDQLALGSVLTGAVGAGGSQYAAPPAAAAPGGAADESATDAAGARATEPKALANGPPVEGGAGVSPTPQARPATPTPSVLSTADPAAIAACEEAAAKDFGDRVGPLLYRATLRWQGTPAVLLAYRLADTSSKGPDHQAFVMALDDCRVLVAQGF